MALPDVGPPPIGIQPYDEAIKNFFVMKVYPDPDLKDEAVVLTPVTGPPVLNLGTQSALNPALAPQDISTRQNQIVRLPATAVTQLGWDFDLKRWTRAYFRRLGWTEEGNKVIQSPQLVPMDILYQLDLWSKYRTTMNQMVRNVLLKFINREAWLEVDLKGVWGKRLIPFTLVYDGPKNITEFEPKDKDRTVRMVFSIVLHAWVIPDAEMLPAVRKTIIDMYMANGPAAFAGFPDKGALPPYPDWLFVGNKTEEIGISTLTDPNP